MTTLLSSKNFLPPVSVVSAGRGYRYSTVAFKSCVWNRHTAELPVPCSIVAVEMQQTNQFEVFYH